MPDFIFALSSETDAGSAGEQPVRDNLTSWNNAVQKSDCFFILSVYALKNSSINFFFRSILKPLWFLNLLFRSEKWPSIAFVVLRMLSPILSYQVKEPRQVCFETPVGTSEFFMDVSSTGRSVSLRPTKMQALACEKRLVVNFLQSVSGIAFL